MRKVQFKRIWLMSAILVFLSLSGYCQYINFEPNKKLGNPTGDEYGMTVYAPDSLAPAVILSKKGYARYNYDESSGFYIQYEYETRVKILNKNGTKYADIEIPYYSKGGVKNDEEVSGISATAYNLENGKVVKTKMKSDLIFSEKITDKLMHVKFSVPSVKEGTIIEYKYKVTSNRLFELRNWYVQTDIPIIYSEYDISIPEYFDFSLELKGSNKITNVRNLETATFSYKNGGLHTQNITCRATNLKFFCHAMPAMKTDKYIWCKDDHISFVSFQLSGITFPGQLPKSFTKSWEDIDKYLLEDKLFGDNLSIGNPYKSEMQEINLENCGTIEDKVISIYAFLRNRIKWDGTYDLGSKNIKKDIKNGSGSNATINFILLSMFKDAGIEAFPVVLSRKSWGVLPVTHPSLTGLNTFVIGFEGTGGRIKYIDGSNNNGFINVLAPVLLVEKARIINKKQSNKWVDLSNLFNSNKHITISADISGEGNIKGSCETEYRGQYSFDYKSKFLNKNDSLDYVGNLEKSNDIKILSFSYEGVDNYSPVCTEKFEFEKNTDINGDLIYINPMIFIDLEKNPFIQEYRALPVEMQYPQNVVMEVYLNIPEGYVIEEIPNPHVIQEEKLGAACSYSITSAGTGLNLKYKFSMKHMTIPETRYKKLRNFYEEAANINNQILVLRKK